MAKLQNELTVLSLDEDENHNIILRDDRLLIPTKLQRRVVNLAHEGHQGVIKTKQLLRQHVWFHGIDSLVQDVCQSCIQCQANTPATNLEPLQMTTIPKTPWTTLCADFTGPFPNNGKYALVIVDEHSRYPVVQITNSTNAKSTIEKLQSIFAMFGIPETLKTDNGPPFQSHEFREFCEMWGIKHRKITPIWPQANGTAERFMRTLGKAIRVAHSEGKDWVHELPKFLMNYRATPHSSTGIAPATCLFRRNMRVKIATAPSKATLEKASDIYTHDDKSKQKMKQYADNSATVHPSSLQIGDVVLVKQPKQNKLTAPYDPKQYVIVEKKGSMVTAEREDKRIVRNSSHFKRIQRQNQPTGRNAPEETFSDIEIEEEQVIPNHDVNAEQRENAHANQRPERQVELRRRARATQLPTKFNDFKM